MSTSAVTPSKTGQAPSPAVKPIDILTTSTSQLYAHLHPVFLLSALFFAFGRLVQDPVNTLLALTPITAALQAVYCIGCLPSTGQTPTTRPGQKKKKATKPQENIGNKIVPAIFSFILTLTLATPVLYIVVVLFGAPLVTHHAHTALLALHLALLSGPTLFYVHGLDVPTWLRLASLQQPVDEVYGMALGACVGTWIGAVPIPLDWDREWQKWPVTVVTGAYAGAVLGKLVGAYVCKGMKMKMT